MSTASFYVYYKVDAGRPDELRAAVRAMFAAIERESGVRGRWLHRRDDPATYMEVYEHVRDATGFERLLARASDAHGVTACLAPGAVRHAELFVTAD